MLGQQRDDTNQWDSIAQSGVLRFNNLELYPRDELGDTGTEPCRRVALGVKLELTSVATVVCNSCFDGFTTRDVGSSAHNCSSCSE